MNSQDCGRRTRCYFTLTLIFLAVNIAVVVAEVCDLPNLNVTVSVVRDKPCPFEPVTVRCLVKKTPDHFFLSWRCLSNRGSENLVLCNPILAFDCEFGAVVNITGACKCTDDSVIVSEATLIPSSFITSDSSLTCGNGQQQKTVSVSAKALETPVLSYEVVSTRKDVQNVTLIWTTPDSSVTDMEYLLTISSSANSRTMITKLTHHHLELYPSDRYLVSVISQRCSGNLKSNTSNTLLLFSDGHSSSTPESQVRTSDTKSSDRVDPVGAVAGGSVAGGVVVAAVIVLSILVCCFCWRKRWQKEEEEAERSGTLDADHAELYKGEELSDHQEREVIGVAMYETVDPPSSTHIPAPYEEVGVVTEVKSSQDIQLTANEAYGPILKGTIQTTPNSANGQVAV